MAEIPAYRGILELQNHIQELSAYGTVDEANAAIGIVLTNTLDEDVSQVLSQIQNDLFLLGSDLSNQNLNDLKK